VKVLQNDCIRAIFGLPWRASVAKLKNIHGLLEVDNLYRLQLAVYVFKWYTGRSPPNGGFNWERLVPMDKGTRLNRSLDVVRGCRLPNYACMAPRESGGVLWNSLPVEVRLAKTVCDFKRRVFDFLLLKQKNM